MVVDDYRQNRSRTNQNVFRTKLKHEIETTRRWQFMERVPYDVLDEAITSAIRARDEVHRRNRDLVAAGQAPQHQLSFASKKTPTQTIVVRSQYCKTSLRFYVRFLHNWEIISVDLEHPRHKTKSLLHHECWRRNHGWPNNDGNIEMDSKLQYNRCLKQWTFFWTYGKDVAPPRENQAGLNICAIDPGVRTFLTW